MQIVGLQHFADTHPSAFSSGMARALVNRPRPFLLDEPFGKPGALTRLRLQDEFIWLWSSQVFRRSVTHDVNEALRLAQRVIVLSERPTHVAADIDVPRDVGAGSSLSEYQTLKRQILRLLGR